MPTRAMPSDKDPSVTYVVDTDAGTCTCPHFVKGLVPKMQETGETLYCKHLKRAMEIEKESEELAEFDKAHLPEDTD